MKVLRIEHAGDPANDDKYSATVTGTKAEIVALFSGGDLGYTPKAIVEVPATSNGATNGAAKAATAKPAEKAAAAPAKAAASAEKPKAAAPATKPAATPKAAATKPALDLVGGDDEEPAAGDDPPEAAETSEDDGTFSLDGEVPAELLEAGRLLTVVSFLHGRGFHTPDAIIAACNKLKDRVPLLKANPNFADRVPVAFAALAQA